MKVRTFSSHNGVRFILTFDVPGFVLFFFSFIWLCLEELYFTLLSGCQTIS